jgi:hypothetical protein
MPYIALYYDIRPRSVYTPSDVRAVLNQTSNSICRSHIVYNSMVLLFTGVAVFILDEFRSSLIVRGSLKLYAMCNRYNDKLITLVETVLTFS